MCIDDVLILALMSGQVNLCHAGRRYPAYEFIRIEMMVDAVDVDVVDVQQQQAVGALGELRQEFPLGHLRGSIGDVAGYILQQDLLTDSILNLPHACHQVRQRRLRVRNWHQIVQIQTIDASPARGNSY